MAVSWFFVKKALTAIALPPMGPLLIALIGLLILRRRPRLGYVMAWIGVLSLAALSLPMVSNRLIGILDVYHPLDLAHVQGAQAIVIVGAGIRREPPAYGGDMLGCLSFERVRYGAWLAKRTKLPVLVTGGTVYGGPPVAVVMKKVLEQDLRTPVRWVEAKSRDTRQNAINSAAILRRAGVNRVILVANSFDTLRATADFRAAGLKVFPAPLGQPSAVYDNVLERLPSMGALQGSYYALYELLANQVRRIRTWARQAGLIRVDRQTDVRMHERLAH